MANAFSPSRAATTVAGSPARSSGRSRANPAPRPGNRARGAAPPARRGNLTARRAIHQEVSTHMQNDRMWNPFANMGSLSGHQLKIVGGEGATVRDAEGREYLDAIASLWYCNVGHGRAELAEAAARQMRTLETYQTFEFYTNP